MLAFLPPYYPLGTPKHIVGVHISVHLLFFIQLPNRASYAQDIAADRRLVCVILCPIPLSCLPPSSPSTQLETE